MSKIDRKVRVRFAPSPTGNLHVGSVRTAIFNWAFTKADKGTFILRIEDTDQKRSTQAFEKNILEGMNWLGLIPDEGPEQGGMLGPYRQSERITAGLYKQYTQQLIEEKKAYYCFETEEELEAERVAAETAGKAYVYSGKSLGLSEGEIKEKLATGAPYTIRFKIPNTETILVKDTLRGDIAFEAQLLSDFIIQKSDGSPAYNFAVVIDDILMQITHVVRGEDHLSNTPKQQLIFEALGKEVPLFCHMPMILGADRSKLSKRHGASAVTDYRDQGYLPEALLNFLSLLGWSHPEAKDLFSMAEMETVFDTNRMSKSNAVFDVEKLNWMNGQYIRLLSPVEFQEKAKIFLSFKTQSAIETLYSSGEIQQIFELVQDACVLLSDVEKQCQIFVEADEHVFQRNALFEFKQDQKLVFEKVISALESDTQGSYLDLFTSLCKHHGFKKGFLMKTVRQGVTGFGSGLGLAELLNILGKETICRRLKHLVAT